MRGVALGSLLRPGWPRFQGVRAFSSQRPPDAGPASKKLLKDDEIVAERVRVLKDRRLLGDFTLFEARLLAQSQSLNLILLRPSADPPVCVIDRYSEFVKGLAEKEAKKEPPSFAFDPSLKSKTVQISEGCASADLARKLASVRKFLLSGQRVDVVIVTRPRRGPEPRARAESGASQARAAQDAAGVAQSRGLAAAPEPDGSLLQKIDFIYSRLADISRPYTLKNKVNISSRQVVLKFWPK